MTDRSGGALPGVTVWVTVSGSTSYTEETTSDTRGVATFQLRSEQGQYTIHITAMLGGNTIASSTVQMGAESPAVTTSYVTGRFYPSDNACTFNVPSTGIAHPTFTVTNFATLNFGGPPFAAFSPTPGQPDVPARSAIYVAGLGALTHFNAVLTGKLSVASAGNHTFTILVDDAYNFAIGGGATRVSGTMRNPPANGASALLHLPILGAFNDGALQATTTMTIHFPHTGSYPYEIDYDECAGPGQDIRVSTVGRFVAIATAPQTS